MTTEQIGFKLFRLRKDGTLGPLFINKSFRLKLVKTYEAEEHRTKVICLSPRLAYIGESTLREIEYARLLGKKMYALESWGKVLGINESHSERVYEAMKQHGLPAWSSSPIDTYAGSGTGFRCPWSENLLNGSCAPSAR